MNSLDKGVSPVRTIRVPDDLWDAYLRSCAYHNIKPAEDLRAFMQKVVDVVAPFLTND